MKQLGLPFLLILLIPFIPVQLSAATIDSNKPNILLIYVDDMGYLPGFTGGSLLETPHMDALAASGIVFQNRYVSCPISAPSRV